MPLRMHQAATDRKGQSGEGTFLPPCFAGGSLRLSAVGACCCSYRRCRISRLSEAKSEMLCLRTGVKCPIWVNADIWRVTAWRGHSEGRLSYLQTFRSHVSLQRRASEGYVNALRQALKQGRDGTAHAFSPAVWGRQNDDGIDGQSYRSSASEG